MNELPRLQRILAATDFDDCALSALEHAKTLARRFGAEITMVHAVPAFATVEPIPLTPVFSGAAAVLPESTAAATALDEYHRLHLTDVVASAPVLQAGDPATSIIATSGSREVDMIVMGTHGRTGVSRALLGSVAEDVIAGSDLPVLTVRCTEARSRVRFERILCPVNYNRSSGKALYYATLIASAFDAELVILHLVESGDYNEEEELDRLRSWVGELSMPARGRLLIHRGDAAEQVNSYARFHGVDLIVLGAVRKGSKTQSILGSTTHKVTRHAPCAVMTVPGPGI